MTIIIDGVDGLDLSIMSTKANFFTLFNLLIALAKNRFDCFMCDPYK